MASYPVAREADSIATGGGKYRPLDSSEIEKLYERMTKVAGRRDAVPLLRHSNNSSHQPKPFKLRDR